jgi:hypothetical protein
LGLKSADFLGSEETESWYGIFVCCLTFHLFLFFEKVRKTEKRHAPGNLVNRSFTLVFTGIITGPSPWFGVNFVAVRIGPKDKKCDIQLLDIRALATGHNILFQLPDTSTDMHGDTH